MMANTIGHGNINYSGPRKLDKAISVKDIILSPTQGGLPDEQEEAQFYA